LAKNLGPALLAETKVAEISSQSDSSFSLRLETRNGVESVSTKSLILPRPQISPVVFSPNSIPHFHRR